MTALIKHVNPVPIVHRRLRFLAVVPLWLGLAGIAGAQAPVYRYVEADGRVVYSDKPPPANAKSAQTKKLGSNFIETSELSYSSQVAQQRFPVTLFTFDCGELCEAAQGLLNKRGVPHSVVTVSQLEGAEKLKALTGKQEAPVLQVGDKLVSNGYNEARWQALLDQAGYPKTPAVRSTPLGKRPETADKKAPSGSETPVVDTPRTAARAGDKGAGDKAAPARPAEKGTYPQ